jgi:hypothetical protein
MNVSIPPALLYAIGTVLVVFGGLRAWHLGWRKKPAPAAPGEAPESPDLDEAPAWDRDRGGGYKRHITFGMLWLVMGLFLIISTILNSRR